MTWRHRFLSMTMPGKSAGGLYTGLLFVWLNNFLFMAYTINTVETTTSFTATVSRLQNPTATISMGSMSETLGGTLNTVYSPQSTSTIGDTSSDLASTLDSKPSYNGLSTIMEARNSTLPSSLPTMINVTSIIPSTPILTTLSSHVSGNQSLFSAITSTGRNSSTAVSMETSSRVVSTVITSVMSNVSSVGPSTNSTIGNQLNMSATYVLTSTPSFNPVSILSSATQVSSESRARNSTLGFYPTTINAMASITPSSPITATLTPGLQGNQTRLVNTTLVSLFSTRNRTSALSLTRSRTVPSTIVTSMLSNVSTVQTSSTSTVKNTSKILTSYAFTSAMFSKRSSVYLMSSFSVRGSNETDSIKTPTPSYTINVRSSSFNKTLVKRPSSTVTMESRDFSSLSITSAEASTIVSVLQNSTVTSNSVALIFSSSLNANVTPTQQLTSKPIFTTRIILATTRVSSEIRSNHSSLVFSRSSINVTSVTTSLPISATLTPDLHGNQSSVSSSTGIGGNSTATASGTIRSTVIKTVMPNLSSVQTSTNFTIGNQLTSTPVPTPSLRPVSNISSSSTTKTLSSTIQTLSETMARNSTSAFSPATINVTSITPSLPISATLTRNQSLVSTITTIDRKSSTAVSMEAPKTVPSTIITSVMSNLSSAQTVNISETYLFTSTPVSTLLLKSVTMISSSFTTTTVLSLSGISSKIQPRNSTLPSSPPIISSTPISTTSSHVSGNQSLFSTITSTGRNNSTTISMETSSRVVSTVITSVMSNVSSVGPSTNSTIGNQLNMSATYILTSTPSFNPVSILSSATQVSSESRARNSTLGFSPTTINAMASITPSSPITATLTPDLQANQTRLVNTTLVSLFSTRNRTSALSLTRSRTVPSTIVTSMLSNVSSIHTSSTSTVKNTSKILTSYAFTSAIFSKRSSVYLMSSFSVRGSNETASIKTPTPSFTINVRSSSFNKTLVKRPSSTVTMESRDFSSLSITSEASTIVSVLQNSTVTSNSVALIFSSSINANVTPTRQLTSKPIFTTRIILATTRVSSEIRSNHSSFVFYRSSINVTSVTTSLPISATLTSDLHGNQSSVSTSTGIGGNSTATASRTIRSTVITTVMPNLSSVQTSTDSTIGNQLTSTPVPTPSLSPVSNISSSSTTKTLSSTIQALSETRARNSTLAFSPGTINVTSIIPSLPISATLTRNQSFSTITTIERKSSTAVSMEAPKTVPSTIITSVMSNLSSAQTVNISETYLFTSTPVSTLLLKSVTMISSSFTTTTVLSLSGISSKIQPRNSTLPSSPPIIPSTPISTTLSSHVSGNQSLFSAITSTGRNSSTTVSMETSSRVVSTVITSVMSNVSSVGPSTNSTIGNQLNMSATYILTSTPSFNPVSILSSATQVSSESRARNSTLGFSPTSINAMASITPSSPITATLTPDLQGNQTRLVNTALVSLFSTRNRTSALSLTRSRTVPSTIVTSMLSNVSSVQTSSTSTVKNTSKILTSYVFTSAIFSKRSSVYLMSSFSVRGSNETDSIKTPTPSYTINVRSSSFNKTLVKRPSSTVTMESRDFSSLSITSAEASTIVSVLQNSTVTSNSVALIFSSSLNANVTPTQQLTSKPIFTTRIILATTRVSSEIRSNHSSLVFSRSSINVTSVTTSLPISATLTPDLHGNQSSVSSSTGIGGNSTATASGTIRSTVIKTVMPNLSSVQTSTNFTIGNQLTSTPVPTPSLSPVSNISSSSTTKTLSSTIQTLSETMARNSTSAFSPATINVTSIIPSLPISATLTRNQSFSTITTIDRKSSTAVSMEAPKTIPSTIITSVMSNLSSAQTVNISETYLFTSTPVSTLVLLKSVTMISSSFTTTTVLSPGISSKIQPRNSTLPSSPPTINITSVTPSPIPTTLTPHLTGNQSLVRTITSSTHSSTLLMSDLVSVQTSTKSTIGRATHVFTMTPVSTSSLSPVSIISPSPTTLKSRVANNTTSSQSSSGVTGTSTSLGLLQTSTMASSRFSMFVSSPFYTRISSSPSSTGNSVVSTLIKPATSQASEESRISTLSYQISTSTLSMLHQNTLSKVSYSTTVRNLVSTGISVLLSNSVSSMPLSTSSVSKTIVSLSGISGVTVSVSASYNRITSFYLLSSLPTTWLLERSTLHTADASPSQLPTSQQHSSESQVTSKVIRLYTTLASYSNGLESTHVIATASSSSIQLSITSAPLSSCRSCSDMLSITAAVSSLIPTSRSTVSVPDEYKLQVSLLIPKNVELDDSFKTDMERKLENQYDLGVRQSTPTRQRRAVNQFQMPRHEIRRAQNDINGDETNVRVKRKTVNETTVKILNMTRVGNSESVIVVFYVSSGGKLVEATNAEKTLNTPSTAETVAELGYHINGKFSAASSKEVEPGKKNRNETLFIVLSVTLPFSFVLLACIFIKWKKNRKNSRKMKLNKVSVQDAERGDRNKEQASERKNGFEERYTRAPELPVKDYSKESIKKPREKLRSKKEPKLYSVPNKQKENALVTPASAFENITRMSYEGSSNVATIDEIPLRFRAIFQQDIEQTGKVPTEQAIVEESGVPRAWMEKKQMIDLHSRSDEKIDNNKVSSATEQGSRAKTRTVEENTDGDSDDTMQIKANIEKWRNKMRQKEKRKEKREERRRLEEDKLIALEQRKLSRRDWLMAQPEIQAILEGDDLPTASSLRKKTYRQKRWRGNEHPSYSESENEVMVMPVRNKKRRRRWHRRAKQVFPAEQDGVRLVSVRPRKQRAYAFGEPGMNETEIDLRYSQPQSESSSVYQRTPSPMIPEGYEEEDNEDNSYDNTCEDEYLDPFVPQYHDPRYLEQPVLVPRYLTTSGQNLTHHNLPLRMQETSLTSTPRISRPLSSHNVNTKHPRTLYYDERHPRPSTLYTGKRTKQNFSSEPDQRTQPPLHHVDNSDGRTHSNAENSPRSTTPRKSNSAVLRNDMETVGERSAPKTVEAEMRNYNISENEAKTLVARVLQRAARNNAHPT